MSDDCIDNVGITNDVSDVEIVEDTLSEITVTEEAVTIVASCDEIIVSPSPDELFYVDVTDETVEINITEDAVTITTDCAQGIPGAPGVASWDNTFSYSIDDVIYYDGNFYVSLTSNTNSQPDTNPSDWTQITTSDGGGAVDSVNAYTGTVVLDPDDLDDTSTTNKFTNTTDISRLANTSGTNTGDQDLSGKQDVLVSGTNIKTINGSSILGAGDLTLSTGSTGLALADQEYTSTYVYVGLDSGAGWQIYRRTRTTNVRQYASGVSDYSTAWTNRVGLIYS